MWGWYTVDRKYLLSDNGMRSDYELAGIRKYCCEAGAQFLEIFSRTVSSSSVSHWKAKRD